MSNYGEDYYESVKREMRFKRNVRWGAVMLLILMFVGMASCVVNAPAKPQRADKLECTDREVVARVWSNAPLYSYTIDGKTYSVNQTECVMTVNFDKVLRKDMYQRMK